MEFSKLQISGTVKKDVSFTTLIHSFGIGVRTRGFVNWVHGIQTFKTHIAAREAIMALALRSLTTLASTSFTVQVGHITCKRHALFVQQVDLPLETVSRGLLAQVVRRGTILRAGRRRVVNVARESTVVQERPRVPVVPLDITKMDTTLRIVSSVRRDELACRRTRENRGIVQRAPQATTKTKRQKPLVNAVPQERLARPRGRQRVTTAPLVDTKTKKPRRVVNSVLRAGSKS